jgi:hypothetical protein
MSRLPLLENPNDHALNNIPFIQKKNITTCLGLKLLDDKAGCREDAVHLVVNQIPPMNS